MRSIRRAAALRRLMGPWLAAVMLVLPAVGATAPTLVDGAEFAEEDIKAAFLFHFATYVEWPPRGDDPAITFAVLSAPQMAERLERFSRDRTIEGQMVRVRRIRGIGELDAEVEVLYIGPSENRRLARLIDQVKGPILLVTDVPGGAPAGAMINFQLIDRRVRFEVALPAVERAGLSMSSRLLGAAWRVETTQCYRRCWQSGPVLADPLMALGAVEAQNRQFSRASTLRSISLPSPNSG